MNLTTKFRFCQKTALVMAVLLAFQAAFPMGAWALTSGPTQPEFNDFEPVGTTQMVDLFSGDFTYNIPLFELPGPDGGYPFNLSYHSGITMDQEATWVGLGWTMNHGAITRTMRGFPDDFNGEKVWRKMDMKPNRTWTFGLRPDVELFGFKNGDKKNNDENDDEDIPGKLNLALAFNVSHNSYKGWGLGFNLGVQTRFFKDEKAAFNGGLNLGVNSFDGASLQPNFSIGGMKEKMGSLQASLNISGREGMQSVSLGYSSKVTIPKRDETKKSGIDAQIASGGRGTASYSFGKSAYSPQVSMPYRGLNYSGSIKTGYAPIWGIGVGANINVSYNTQRLKKRDVWEKQAAYGYFHLKDRGSMDKALLDFNREKDGAIRESTPNLGTPITTPDIYSVKGQGVGGVYRAFRSNIGILTDPWKTSLSGGGSLGLELDPGNDFDLGVNLGGNVSVTSSTKWDVAGSDELKKLYHSESGSDPAYESYYFKAGGELTAEANNAYDYIGGEEAVNVKLGQNILTRMNFDQGGILKFANGEELPITEGARSARKPRANSIQPITNEQLILNGTEALKEYQIDYYTNTQINQYKNDPAQTLARNWEDDHQKKHFAGITALQENGARYVYALPVKNHRQEEMVFSVNGSGSVDYCNPLISNYLNAAGEIEHRVADTDEYLNQTRLPEYTHAYLLTSILGADYVDLDTIAGPSSGDYGYWVKFNYVKTSDSYKWKTPFHGANYLKGKMTDKSDDKASIMYGEREQYYLATAETRTHIAEFSIGERRDGRGAASQVQTTGMDLGSTGASYKLNEIALYSKLERFNADGSVNTNAEAIKKVGFNYDYSLCGQVKNNDGSFDGAGEDYYGNPIAINGNKGKLSLSKVFFEYRNNTRGRLAPYKFKYSATNPNYSDQNYDRWGTYKPIVNNCDILTYPYTHQASQTDANIAAWHLEEIALPSGATMKVDYESDRYGYVQDRKAMQMFEVTDVGASGETGYIREFNTNSEEGENRHDNGTLSANDRKIYFQLTNTSTLIEDYIDGLHGVKRLPDSSLDISNAQIYYKMLVDMNGKGSWEYISGYAGISDYGYDDATTGFIELKPLEIGAKVNKRHFHPIVAAAWQWLKMEYPSALYTKKSLSSFDQRNFKDALGEFSSAFGAIQSIFKNYYRHCSVKKLAGEVDISSSYIRLVNPLQNKYGGGVRVAKITIDDKWDIGEDGLADVLTYGQVFDYTTTNENGKTISSGVAINEPAIGYDECALRYGKQWSEQQLFKSDENMFYEYPNNESYYPGASVGYSKVTVSSLATDLARVPRGDLPAGFATTGETVNEFYTAKDFPVFVEETLLDKKVGEIPWGTITLGTLTSNNYTGSQGYAITLNDMHGKPHKVTHYGLDNGAARINQKLSEVVYTYASDSVEVYTVAGVKKKARVLKNEVEVLLSDDPTAAYAQTEKQQLGVDYEFFTDMRETSTYGSSASVDFNVDFTKPLFIAFTGIPRFSLSQGRTRTAVTNKIVRKSGILTQVDAYDGQSHIRTNNRVFDPMTGEPLLTTVNNSFDDLVYNYNIPARYAYDRMGEAYKNIGLSFMGQLQINAQCGLFEMVGVPPDKEALLVPGDECVVTNIYATDPCATDYPELCNHAKFTFVGERAGSYLFENNDLRVDVEPVNVDMLITRSGRRNHLNAKAANITALVDPTKGRSQELTTQAVIAVPDDATTYTNSTKLVTHRTIDSVLSASAIIYSDEWDLERSSCIEDTMTIVLPPAPCLCLYVGISYSGEEAPPMCDIDVNYSTYTTGGGTQGHTQSITVDEEQYCTENGIPLALGNVDACALVACTRDGFVLNSFSVDMTNSGAACINNISESFSFVVLPNPDGLDCTGGGSGIDTTFTLAERSFHLGQKGIWRPLRDYTYVEDRNASDRSATSAVDIRKEGHFNDLSLFNWKNPFYLQSTAGKKWKHSSETTKYARNGEQVESRDVLGLYSSAIYGYKDNLPTAVAANARYYEVAFESFEEHESGAVDEVDETGHIDLDCVTTSKTATETYNILGGYQAGTHIWIDKPYYSNIPLPNHLTLVLQDENGLETSVEALVTEITSLSPSAAGLDIPFREDICVLRIIPFNTACEGLNNNLKNGRAIFSYCYDVPASTSCNVSLSEAAAHTGKKSLKVTANSEFDQKTLRLETGREYVISGWIHQPDVEHYTYASNIGLVVKQGTVGGLFSPAGEIIEGWQRIEGTFIYNGNEDLKLEFISGNDTVYFDDIRIYPLDGGMQTYVYDPVDYRLRAVLDNNNYATLYFYDDEGNLFLQKKETARGIKTIQETKQYIIDGTD